MQLNTHFYDGKLPKNNEPINKLREADQESLKTDKIDLFNWLVEKIKNRNNTYYTTTAVRSIDMIRDNIHMGPNNDTSDNIYACDVLYLIIQKIKDMNEKDLDDVIIFLEEQLSDIVTSGSCPAGRTKRLVQVYLIFYE